MIHLFSSFDSTQDFVGLLWSDEAHEWSDVALLAGGVDEGEADYDVVEEADINNPSGAWDAVEEMEKEAGSERSAATPATYYWDGDNVIFYAHKLILSCASDYFGDLWQGQFADRSATKMVLPDVGPIMLQRLLETIYANGRVRKGTGCRLEVGSSEAGTAKVIKCRPSGINEHNALNSFIVSNKYGVITMELSAEEEMKRWVDEDNAWALLTHPAILLSPHALLYRYCIHFASRRYIAGETETTENWQLLAEREKDAIKDSAKSFPLRFLLSLIAQNFNQLRLSQSKKLHSKWQSMKEMKEEEQDLADFFKTNLSDTKLYETSYYLKIFKESIKSVFLEQMQEIHALPVKETHFTFSPNISSPSSSTSSSNADPPALKHPSSLDAQFIDPPESIKQKYSSELTDIDCPDLAWGSRAHIASLGPEGIASALSLKRWNLNLVSGGSKDKKKKKSETSSSSQSSSGTDLSNTPVLRISCTPSPFFAPRKLKTATQNGQPREYFDNGKIAFLRDRRSRPSPWKSSKEGESSSSASKQETGAGSSADKYAIDNGTLQALLSSVDIPSEPLVAVKRAFQASMPSVAAVNPNHFNPDADEQEEGEDRDRRAIMRAARERRHRRRNPFERRPRDERRGGRNWDPAQYDASETDSDSSSSSSSMSEAGSDESMSDSGSEDNGMTALELLRARRRRARGGDGESGSESDSDAYFEPAYRRADDSSSSSSSTDEDRELEEALKGFGDVKMDLEMLSPTRLQLKVSNVSLRLPTTKMSIGKETNPARAQKSREDAHQLAYNRFQDFAFDPLYDQPDLSLASILMSDGTKTTNNTRYARKDRETRLFEEAVRRSQKGGSSNSGPASTSNEGSGDDSKVLPWDIIVKMIAEARANGNAELAMWELDCPCEDEGIMDLLVSGLSFSIQLDIASFSPYDMSAITSAVIGGTLSAFMPGAFGSFKIPAHHQNQKPQKSSYRDYDEVFSSLSSIKKKEEEAHPSKKTKDAYRRPPGDFEVGESEDSDSSSSSGSSMSSDFSDSFVPSSIADLLAQVEAMLPHHFSVGSRNKRDAAFIFGNDPEAATRQVLVFDAKVTECQIDKVHIRPIAVNRTGETSLINSRSSAPSPAHPFSLWPHFAPAALPALHVALTDSVRQHLTLPVAFMASQLSTLSLQHYVTATELLGA